MSTLRNRSTAKQAEQKRQIGESSGEIMMSGHCGALMRLLGQVGERGKAARLASRCSEFATLGWRDSLRVLLGPQIAHVGPADTPTNVEQG